MLLSSYERMIARRYLLPGRGEAFIALVAGISLIAVMLGVAALVIVMSVMNGFRAELFDKIVGLNGHAVVQGYNGVLRDWRQVLDDARKTPGVTSATPLIEQPLFATLEGRSDFVLVRGMEVPDIVGKSHDPRQCEGRLAHFARAQQRNGRDRVAPGGVPGGVGGERHLDHQPARPGDALRHRTPDGELSGRSDRRSRRLRL